VQEHDCPRVRMFSHDVRLKRRACQSRRISLTVSYADVPVAISSATSAASTGRHALALSGTRSALKLVQSTSWTAAQHVASVRVRARLPKKLNVYVRVTIVPTNTGLATKARRYARSAPRRFSYTL
jgi:hypothetical protein